MNNARLTASSSLLGIGIAGLSVFAIIPFLPAAYWPGGELGFTELGSALCYLCAFVLGLYRVIATKTNRLWFCTLWCLFTFVFAGEELSWLQHILNYETPAPIAEINVQNEFNIHNLNILKGGSLHSTVSGKETFNASLILDGQNIFRALFISYFVLAPIAIRSIWSRWGSFNGIIDLVPENNLIATVAFVITASIVSYFLNAEAHDSITEVRELFYAVFILFYVYFYLGKRPDTDDSS